LSDYNS
jgi:hypothetical protein